MPGEYVTVTFRVPRELDELMEKLCYEVIGKMKVKVRSKSDVVRMLVVDALVRRFPELEEALSTPKLEEFLEASPEGAPAGGQE